MRRLRSALLLSFAASCGGSDPASDSSAEGGTVIIAVAADADALVPPLVNGTQARIVTDLLFDHLAEVGPSLNTVGDRDFIPVLAERWSWGADSLSIRFVLNAKARWHDGRPVVAEDLRTGLALIKDSATASPIAGDVRDIDSVAVVDSLTAVVHFAQQSAEQFYSASLIVPMPTHVYGSLIGGALRTSEASRAPVGSGPYRLSVWEPKVRTELLAVEGHYRGRSKLDRVAFVNSPDPVAGVARVLSGEADLWENLPPGEVARVAARPSVELLSYPSYDYGYLGFNLFDPKDPSRPHPLFGELAMRRALTMAVDREGLVRALFDSLARPALGPFTRAQATADSTITQIPFDTTRASALLDSLGWRDANGDGIRERGGRPLRFRALVPASSRNRQRAAVVVQEQLRKVGVEMELENAEFGAFLAAVGARTHDAMLGGWRTTPSPRGIRGTWGMASARTKGGQNAGRYESAQFDAAVDSGLTAMDPTTVRSYFRRAYQIIVDDAPAIWLYEPRNLSIVHRRFQRPAWRTDAWWLSLREWSVPPDVRLPRDARPDSTAR